MWKLLSRAFQWCITLYSRKWTVWPWEAIFSKKLPEKQLFWVSRFRINWLWAAITPVQNLQISKTTTFSESSGRQLSDELSGSPLASILSDRQPIEFFWRDTPQKKAICWFYQNYLRFGFYDIYTRSHHEQAEPLTIMKMYNIRGLRGLDSWSKE